jgi:hypothetical protein
MTRLPIDTAFNAAVLRMTRILLPTGFDVVDDGAPSTLDELRDTYIRTGRIVVWSGGSDKNIFADPAVNHAMRAWHDHRHLTYQLPFEPEGEREVAFLQMTDLRVYLKPSMAQYNEWCALIHAEVNGQIEYMANHGGEFPDDQYAFVSAYLNDPIAACAATVRF